MDNKAAAKIESVHTARRPEPKAVALDLGPEIVRYPQLPPDITFADFADKLRQIHRLATNIEDATFCNGSNHCWRDDLGYTHFPDGQDKEAILQYGFEQAAKLPEYRPVILAVAIGAAHPFNPDGNGRALRVVHALMCGRSNQEIAGLKLAGPRRHELETSQQDSIKLSPPTALASHLRSYAHELAGVPERRHIFAVPDEEDLSTYTDIMGALAPDDKATLQTALDLTRKFTDVYSEDSDALHFALSKMAAGDRRDEVKVAEFLPGGSGSGAEFVAAVREYHYQRAKAAIDCIGPGEFADRAVLLEGDSQPRTIREHYLRLTKSLASPVK